MCPEVCFSKVTSSLRTRKAIALKISNLMVTELLYSHIPNMNRGSLYARSFKNIHLSVLDRLIKNGLAGPKKFPGLSENGSWPILSMFYQPLIINALIMTSIAKLHFIVHQYASL